MADFPGEIANAGGNLEGDLVEDDHHHGVHVVQDLNQPFIDDNAAGAVDPNVGGEAHDDDVVNVDPGANLMVVDENAAVDVHHGVPDLNVPYVNEDAVELMAAAAHNDGEGPPPQQQHPPPPLPMPMPPVRQAAPTALVHAPYPAFIPLYQPPPPPFQLPGIPNFIHNLSLVPPFGRPRPLQGFFHNPVLAYIPRGPPQALPPHMPNPLVHHLPLPPQALPFPLPLPLPPQLQIGPRPPAPPPIEEEIPGMGPIPVHLQVPEHHLLRLCRKRLTRTDLTCNLIITGPNREFFRYRANQAGYNFPLVVNVVIINGPAAPVTLYRYTDGDKDRFLLSWILLVRGQQGQGFNLVRNQFVDMWFEIAPPTINIYIQGDQPPPPPPPA